MYIYIFMYWGWRVEKEATILGPVVTQSASFERRLRIIVQLFLH